MNRDTIAGKLKYHTENWVSAGLMGLSICVLAWGGWNVIDDVFQRVVPASYYFEYDADAPVEPVSSSISYTQNMRFRSNAVYYHDIDMEWQDTLYCRMALSGTVLKIATQIWKEHKTPADVPQTWVWGKRQIPLGASECQLRGTVIGETPRGYRKTFEYETVWWRVEN